MVRLWKWLMLGPPLSGEPSCRPEGNDWVITLPEEPRDRTPGLWIVHFAWGLITVVGLIATISVLANPKAAALTHGRPTGGVAVVLGLMAVGYALTLRVSRERSARQLVCTPQELCLRRRVTYFGITWFRRPYSIRWSELSELRRTGDGLVIVRSDGRTGQLLSCATEEQAEWVYQQLSAILVDRTIPAAAAIVWVRRDGSLAVESRVVPESYAPWRVNDSRDRLTIDLPTARTPLAEVRSGIDWAERLVRVGGVGMVVGMAGVVAVQILARVLPERWAMGQLFPVAIFSYLMLAVAFAVVFLAWAQLSNRRRELPASTRATRRITTRLTADATGLTRTNALGEVEFIERNTIRRIETDMRASHGEDSSTYTSTLSARLESGEAVHLLDRVFAEDEVSRQVMAALGSRMGQLLDLPPVALTPT